MRVARIMGIAITLVGAAIMSNGTAALAATPSKKGLPDTCVLITKTDVATAFAKLDPVFQPISIAESTPSKPASQGGFGEGACETVFALPGSVAGRVLVTANPITKAIPCPLPGQPGKYTTISKAKAVIQPIPGSPNVVRNVTFVDGGACVNIQIFLSGGPNKLPESAFVDLAKVALAKKI